MNLAQHAFSSEDIARALAFLRAEQAPPLTVAEVIAIHEAGRRERHRPKGWRSIAAKLRNVSRALGDRQVASITHDDADAYIAARVQGGVCRSTAGQDLQTLITAINFAIKRKRLTANPLQGYEFALCKGGRDRAFTEAEIDAMLKAARKLKAWQVFAVISVMGWTGARPSELLNSKADAIEWNTGVLTIAADVAKTGVARAAVVLPDGLAALKKVARKRSQWLIPSVRFKERPCSYAMLNRQWLAVVAAAGIAPNKDGSRAELYAMRGTLATKLVYEHGYSTFELMGAMGWTSPSQAKSYVRTGEKQMLAQAAKLQAKKGSVQI